VGEPRVGFEASLGQMGRGIGGGGNIADIGGKSYTDPMDSKVITWTGSQAPNLGKVWVSEFDGAALGTFGGDRLIGGDKNEDGCLLWRGNSWTFACLIDAHNSSQSTDAILSLLEAQHSNISSMADCEISAGFTQLRAFLPSLFLDNLDILGRVQGEAACLICFQKEGFLLWFSVGDNLGLLLHHDLARLGQTMLNARQFYEWIGERSALELDVPCYSMGVRELRQGNNHIVLATDGLLSMCAREDELGPTLFEMIDEDAAPARLVRNSLARVQAAHGKDSASMVAWTVRNERIGLRPSS
jgi:hypothetical protein